MFVKTAAMSAVFHLFHAWENICLCETTQVSYVLELNPQTAVYHPLCWFHVQVLVFWKNLLTARLIVTFNGGFTLCKYFCHQLLLVMTHTYHGCFKCNRGHFSAMNHFSLLCAGSLWEHTWTRLRAVYCAALLAEVTGISEYCVASVAAY